jgi:hypothetical protein
MGQRGKGDRDAERHVDLLEGRDVAARRYVVPARALHRLGHRRRLVFADSVRKGVVAALLVVIASALAPAAAAAPASNGLEPSLLTVRLDGAVVNGAAANLPITQDLAFGTTYAVCCPAGAETTKVFSTGWSIATLIAAAGATPSTVRSVTIERGDGTGIALLGPDFDPATPGGLDFPQTACAPSPPSGPSWSCPAFIYARGIGTTQSLSFFRPERAAAPADDNTADWLQRPVGQGLVVDVETVGHLDVRAVADRARATTGQPVHFSATASGAAPGEQLTYAWSLSDGTTVGGATATHAFAHAGTFQVIATVAGSAGSGGSSAPITIVVGSRGGSPGPGGGTSTNLPPTRGGDHGGGTVTPPTESGTPRAAGGGAENTDAPNVRGTTSTANANPAAEPPTASPPERATAEPTSAGSVVRGELLAGSVAADYQGGRVAAGSATKQATGAGGTAPGRDSIDWGVVFGIGAVIGLYLGGASLESRSRRVHP